MATAREIYHQGKDAYRDGLSVNPYPVDTAEFTMWNHGYLDASTSPRTVKNSVSQWPDGHFYFFWEGQYFPLKSRTLEDAQKEAIRLQFELESG